MELMDHTMPGVATSPVLPGVEVDERAARRTLRDQIAKIERDLASAFVDSYPGGPAPAPLARRGGPRLLNLGELERVRDELAERLRSARGELVERAERQAEKRLLLENMLLEPGRHRWVRVTNEELGERGCGSYHVLPRHGVVGMLAGWWHVKVSSGCPLARGPRLAAAPDQAHSAADSWDVAAASV
jgi:transposase InsO family protein